MAVTGAPKVAPICFQASMKLVLRLRTKTKLTTSTFSLAILMATGLLKWSMREPGGVK